MNPSRQQHLQHLVFQLPQIRRELDENLIELLAELHERKAEEHVNEKHEGLSIYLRDYFRPLASWLKRMGRHLENGDLLDGILDANRKRRSAEKDLRRFLYPSDFENSKLEQYSKAIIDLELLTEFLHPEDYGSIDPQDLQNKQTAAKFWNERSRPLCKSLDNVCKNLPDALRPFYDLAALFEKWTDHQRYSTSATLDRLNSREDLSVPESEALFDQAKSELSRCIKLCGQFRPGFNTAVNKQLNQFTYEHFNNSMEQLQKFAERRLQERPQSQKSPGESPDSLSPNRIPQPDATEVSLHSKRTCLIVSETELDFLGVKFDKSGLQGRALKILVREIADVPICDLKRCCCEKGQRDACECKVPKLKSTEDFKEAYKRFVDDDGAFSKTLRSVISKIQTKLKQKLGIAADVKLIENKKNNAEPKSKSGSYCLNLNALLNALESKIPRHVTEDAHSTSSRD